MSVPTVLLHVGIAPVRRRAAIVMALAFDAIIADRRVEPTQAHRHSADVFAAVRDTVLGSVNTTMT